MKVREVPNERLARTASESSGAKEDFWNHQSGVKFLCLMGHFKNSAFGFMDPSVFVYLLPLPPGKNRGFHLSTHLQHFCPYIPYIHTYIQLLLHSGLRGSAGATLAVMGWGQGYNLSEATKKDKQPHTDSYGHCSIPNWSHMHAVFGLWEEPGEPRQNPCRHMENHEGPRPRSNPRSLHCEETAQLSLHHRAANRRFAWEQQMLTFPGAKCFVGGRSFPFEAITQTKWTK